MSRLFGTILMTVGVLVGAAAGYWYAGVPVASQASITQPDPSIPGRKILYYRDPGGAPLWSLTPKKDEQGRDYVPVYEDDELELGPGGELKPRQPTAARSRRILYYRNPMGLPDTSPVPKKDWMGMDYIPVYEGEEPDDDKTVKVSLDRVQRSGVRTETVETRVLTQTVRAIGTAAMDERRLTVVTLRSDGYIEDLFVNTTGQTVRAGEPLFRVYSPQIQQAQTDLLVAVRAAQLNSAGSDIDPSLEGARQRLRNLGVPEGRIREVLQTGTNPRTIDWLASTGGTVISKRVINGQRVLAGEELYRIADLSQLWVIADVAEADIQAIKPGTRATVIFRAFPTQPIEGEVTFIYPEVRPETRTVRVRIEVANPDGRLKTGMYADVLFQTGADHGAVVAVPSSSIIDSGSRQVVLVARGEGRFQPRPVKLGRRGDGYVEIIDGVRKGEEVVTAATFLIDAESNLRAALRAFTPDPPLSGPPEPPVPVAQDTTK